MDLPTRARVEKIVAAALAIGVEQRPAFLDRACGGDQVLRRKVESKLAAHAEADSSPETAERSTETMTHPGQPVGRQVGPYRLDREIGRGGMGAVYLGARADEEFRKRVAVKLLKRGMDTDEILRRFRAERQILAVLEHPNIARLLDGGTTDDGLPFFVMEYVEGQPIDRYCDEHRLSIEERLQLFRRVCSAVHYAHQNLIVHRDLKPGNILVTDDGVPKLLDFGIAKLLNPELLAQTVTPTATGIRPMTPDYASPEQMRGATITTASDVYSLGVLLYLLLVGRSPYRMEELSPHELSRAVSEEEPEPPSRLVDLPRGKGEQPTDLDAVAQARSLTRERLRRRLDGDLDQIVLMALRKEPWRRYGSAAELSEDLRRHLAGLPVVAQRDTLGYRIGKFIRRHRFGVGAAGAFVALLAAFGLSMAVQSSRIARERDRAEHEAAKAQAINKFMQGVLGAPDPMEGGEREVTVVEALAAAVPQIDEAFAGQPEIEAAVRLTVGNVYRSLGRYNEAEALIREGVQIRRRLLGATHAEVADSLDALGTVLQETGNFDDAEAAHREALAIRRSVLGARHEDTAKTLGNLGVVLLYKGQIDAAIAPLREALAIHRQTQGLDHPDVATAMGNLAGVLERAGQLEEAEELSREALTIRRRVLGDEHALVAFNLDQLATVLDQRGEPNAAEPLYREALAIRRKVMGDTHRDVAESLNNLALLLMKGNRFDEAERLYDDALEIIKGSVGESHPDYALGLTNLAGIFEARQEWARAAAVYERALPILETALGSEHYLVANTRSLYGADLIELGRYADAEGELLAAFADLEAALGKKHWRSRRALSSVVRLYEVWKRPDEAANYRRRLTAEP